MGFGGSIGGKISSGGKSLGGKIASGGKGLGGALVGTAQDAGILGVGQYKASGHKIDSAAFGDNESEARQAEFAKQLQVTQARAEPKMSAAQVGNAATAKAATINQRPQEEFRNQQEALASQLMAQTQGQGPSLAQSQLKQATDRNISQQMAMAASQRGATAGQGLRQVAQNAAMANQQAAQQSADLRMQEQMAAQQQLAGVAGAAREQDIGLATNQAGLQQQTALANQDASNQFKLTQAQLNQEAAANNQQSSLQMTGLNDANSQFLNQGLMTMEQQDREALMAKQKLEVDQKLGIASTNAGAYNSASQARAGMIGGIGQGVAMAAMLSDKTKKTDIEEDTTKTQKFLNAWSAANKEQDSSSDPAKGSRQTGKAIGSGLFALGKSLMSGGSAPTGNVGQTAAPMGASAAPMMVAAHGGKVPGEAPYPGDDPRNDVVDAKVSPGEVIVPRTAAEDEDKLKAFVEALSNSSYTYKDPKYGEGTHVSPMAQELESTELGKSMVTDTPEGKVVNYAKAGGLLLSTAAMLNDRMNGLDEKLAVALKKKRSA